MTDPEASTKLWAASYSLGSAFLCELHSGVDPLRGYKDDHKWGSSHLGSPWGGRALSFSMALTQVLGLTLIGPTRSCTHH